MKKGIAFLVFVFAMFALAAPVSAGIPVRVTITGQVEFNQINQPPLNAVQSGETATMMFALDSDEWENNMFFPTRHYFINPWSYSLTFDSAAAELQDPFPAGFEPLFVIRDNDPAVDGFFTSINPNHPFGWGLPLNTSGFFGQFADSFRVTYTGDTLSSMDILDAVGTYDFTDLTVFGWTIDDGPFNAMFIIFDHMTIEIIPTDEDEDGIDDWDDACAGTVIPESVPTVHLGVNRWALVDEDGTFDTEHPNGNGPGFMFDLQDTAGCSCEQIIEESGLGQGHSKFGCSNSAMLEWVDALAGSNYLSGGNSQPQDLSTDATPNEGGMSEFDMGSTQTGTQPDATGDAPLDRLDGPVPEDARGTDVRKPKRERAR